jgi:UDP-glucose 4-epimerase
MMFCVVTGGAGFIGSHLVDALVAAGDEVLVIDNCSAGTRENLGSHLENGRIRFLECDLLAGGWQDALAGADRVYHIAADPDVRGSAREPDAVFGNNVVATERVLEAMRVHGIPELVFTSTSTVYGEAAQIPTPGVIWDFIHKLQADPRELEILGDGKQTKSYLEVGACIGAIRYAIGHASGRYNVFNIGSEDWVDVVTIADVIVDEMGLEGVRYRFTGGDRGWVGDVPKMLLSVEKLKGLGWTPEIGSVASVRSAVRALLGA